MDVSPIRAEVLARRARLLSQRPSATHRERVAQVVTVSAGGQSFGLPLDAVDGIFPSRPVAQLPELPPWLPGLLQLKGEMVAVLDLARWFQVPDPPSARVLALLLHQGRRLALSADAVLGLREVYADELSDAHGAAAGARPVRAVTRDLLLVLDVAALFAHPDVTVEGG
jgi:chemotaxis signal transduction protein